eukprot:4005574-Prymnesium_polylepis.1
MAAAPKMATAPKMAGRASSRSRRWRTGWTQSCCEPSKPTPRCHLRARVCQIAVGACVPDCGVCVCARLRRVR